MGRSAQNSFLFLPQKQKPKRRLGDHNPLLKIISGVKFNDGIEVIGSAQAAGADASVTKFRR